MRRPPRGVSPLPRGAARRRLRAVLHLLGLCRQPARERLGGDHRPPERREGPLVRAPRRRPALLRRGRPQPLKLVRRPRPRGRELRRGRGRPPLRPRRAAGGPVGGRRVHGDGVLRKVREPDGRKGPGGAAPLGGRRDCGLARGVRRAARCGRAEGGARSGRLLRGEWREPHAVRGEGRPPLPHHLVCVEKLTLPYLRWTGMRASRHRSPR